MTAGRKPGSVRKAMGPLESPKSENPLRKQRVF